MGRRTGQFEVEDRVIEFLNLLVKSNVGGVSDGFFVLHNESYKWTTVVKHQRASSHISQIILFQDVVEVHLGESVPL